MPMAIPIRPSLSGTTGPACVIHIGIFPAYSSFIGSGYGGDFFQVWKNAMDFAAAGCVENCGNGTTGPGEQCDDGNTATATAARRACPYDVEPRAACTDDGNVCTDDRCDGAGGCGVNNTDLCDDNDACTENDVCAGGSCGGSTVFCDDADQCTQDSCDSGIRLHLRSGADRGVQDRWEHQIENQEQHERRSRPDPLEMEEGRVDYIRRVRISDDQYGLRALHLRRNWHRDDRHSAGLGLDGEGPEALQVQGHHRRLRWRVQGKAQGWPCW